MNFVKHVGKHNSKKVIVLWTTIPGVDDMCLVTYTETLPRQYHDDLIMVLESPQGQSAKELNEVLHRSLMKDGRNMLTTLHSEGWIKKVPTNQVIITPTPTSNVRLDELNNLLKKMNEGEEAVKKLAELDSQMGMRDKTKPQAKTATIKPEPNTAATDVLDNTQLAKQRIEQAKKMRAEAKMLTEEARRLEKEAQEMSKSNASSQEEKTITTA
jgi:hypothetical protein